MAIGAHTTFDDTHTVGKKYTGKNLIQVWSLGGMTNDQPPYLAMGMAHDLGCIWDLKWFPNGYLVQENHTRLGLLAAAFGEGTVKIYSVPHPKHLLDYHSMGLLFHNHYQISKHSKKKKNNNNNSL